MSREPATIGRHLATFNLFREPDNSLHVTIAEARGVSEELGQSGAPLHLCAMTALRAALGQQREREAGDAQALADPVGRAAIEAMKDQLLIVLLNRLGGEAVVPVAEIDGTGGWLFFLSCDERNTFTFKTKRKQ